MSIEYFVLKSGRFLTLGIAILFLLLKYYALPDMVAVFYNIKNKPEGFLPKDQFFYLISGLFTVINLIMPILINLFKKYPAEDLNFINRLFNKNLDKKAISDFFENWINLIITFLNLLIFISLMIIAKLNSSEYNSSIGDFAWLQKSFLLVIILIVGYPLIRVIFYKNNGLN